MDEDWTPHYENSAEFGPMWTDIHLPHPEWPEGIQIHNNKMYFHGLLCVPELLAPKLLWEFHKISGHIGTDRAIKQASYKYCIPSSIPTSPILESYRKKCTTCQAITPPHFPRLGKIEKFPIPERVMHSVALDIFSMPPTTWQDTPYDCILLCVDRLSGWIFACPTQGTGLTAEKCAILMMDKGWEPFGIPTNVHSDHGPQFIGSWFKYMCARLGVTHTLSQPHRHRANGRAERAGQQLLQLLKAINTDPSFNWVEALPRALYIHHNNIGESGLSPYHILFGRERLVPGIPYTPERECEDAQQFFERMEAIDHKIAQTLNNLHDTHYTSFNTHKPPRETFAVDDLVWVLNPLDLSTHTKITPRWTGPYKITSRVGAHSYIVANKRGHTTSVHVDQLKIYIPLNELGELTGL
jgi:hypothetical protein